MQPRPDRADRGGEIGDGPFHGGRAPGEHEHAAGDRLVQHGLQRERVRRALWGVVRRGRVERVLVGRAIGLVVDDHEPVRGANEQVDEALEEDAVDRRAHG